MITAGSIVKNILNKRKMTQMDLVRRINNIYGKEVANRQHLNNYINGTRAYIGNTYSIYIEKALDLPEGFLCKMEKK